VGEVQGTKLSILNSGCKKGKVGYEGRSGPGKRQRVLTGHCAERRDYKRERKNGSIGFVGSGGGPDLKGVRKGKGSLKMGKSGVESFIGRVTVRETSRYSR